MELAHINDQSQHDYLASLIRSSLPAIHFNPPGPTMWIGLHKMSSEQPFWQDDCAGLSSGYNPVPTYRSAEACYMLHDQEPTYVEEDCNIPKPFICQAETLEYQSCYTEVRTVYDAIINNQYRVEDVASNCRFWCSFSNCVGYRFYDNEQGSCRFFTLSYGYTYKKGYLKFTKGEMYSFL
ncbi:uncharacterized protein [Argopecten irradians]|uniref:uncharacterized protein n=1 Tax=Argopecten irradians TaxID=31199 RepID=UPI00371A0800